MGDIHNRLRTLDWSSVLHPALKTNLGTRDKTSELEEPARRRTPKHGDSGDKNLNLLKGVRHVLLSSHHLTNNKQNTPKAHHFYHRCCNQTQEAKHQDPTRMPQERSLSPTTAPRPRSQPTAITERKNASSTLKQD
ncbi:hypothetical protein Bca4012_090317 [Brassica carinata]